MTEWKPPLWLRLEERISFNLVLLDQLNRSMPRNAIAEMIDHATGKAASDVRDAKRIARRLRRYKLLLSRETGEDVSVELEDAILGN
jgi:hypothetical protein